MSSPLEQSFKHRLQNIAKERNLTAAAVWNNVIAERFLVRLSRSSHHTHFILKGGTLLSKLIALGRETQDIDFAIERLSNDIRVLQKVFDEIVQIDVGDGFQFVNPKIERLEHFHMQYQGAHVTMEVLFGKARFPLCIDLGFGDVVSAVEKDLFLISGMKGPLFESSVTLKCYPMEFIFAEKLETVVHKGSDNSRMKDFHDLFTLIQTKSALNGRDLEHAIRAVFVHRGTPIKIPVHFSNPQLEDLQVYWEHYHHILESSTHVPAQISKLIKEINDWIDQRVDLK
jgi:predicted nucleotidyltransferase component of viral defense system